MSGFHELGDEFAGDEANEEWDAAWAAYSSGDSPDTASGSLQVSTTLDLPVGPVEIRGDDPGIELCLINPEAPAGAPESVVVGTSGAAGSDLQIDNQFDTEGENPVVLTVNLNTQEDGRISYSVLDRRGDDVASGDLTDTESAVDLLGRVLDASVTADGVHVYLDAACLVVDGRGVLILADDVAERDSTCRALIAQGASYLTDSIVALSSATRVVSGVARRRFGVDQIRTVRSAVIHEVLVVGGSSPSQNLLDCAEELSRFVNPSSRSNPLAVPYLAGLLNRATTRVVAADSAGSGASSSALGESEPSAQDAGEEGLLVLSELAPLDDQPRWLLSSDDGALILRGGQEPYRPADEELQAAETSLLETNRKRTVPAAFGLPGCPPSGALDELWSDLSAGDLSSIPTGVAAELVSRGMVRAADTEDVQAAIGSARERSRSAMDLLGEVLDATSLLRPPAVVLGQVVDAVDGSLPSRLVDITHLDLLVPVDEWGEYLNALALIGLERGSLTVSGRNLEAGFGVVLSRGGDDPLEVEVCRTLATGPFGVLVDPSEFHEMAVPVRCGARWFRALHPAHRFIHACLRFERTEGTDMAVARSVVSNAPQLPMLTAQMLDTAERLGAARTVLAVVGEVSELLLGLPEHLVGIAVGRNTRVKKTRRLGRRS